MKILAIDTSSNVATAAIMDDDKLISEVIINHKKTHSQKLMPIVKKTLDECELTVQDIDVFSVSTGPGSFTGLRIGVATAKALAHSMDKPIVGVPTLDALAFSIPFFKGIICPIMDARNNQVFTALYKWENNMINRISDYMGIDINDLLEQIDAKYNRIIFLGDGVKSFKQIVKDKLGDKVYFAPRSHSMQRASLVAELGLQKYNSGEIDDYMTLSPFYLRKSQAERLRENNQST